MTSITEKDLAKLKKNGFINIKKFFPKEEISNLLSEILEIDCGRSILPNRRLTDSETKELISRAKEVGLI